MWVIVVFQHKWEKVHFIIIYIQPDILLVITSPEHKSTQKVQKHNHSRNLRSNSSITCMFNFKFEDFTKRPVCTKSPRNKRNIKITLLQIISFYPVALFQQKIVITNKILHLSPKLCFLASFIHFISLSSEGIAFFSSAMQHSAFCTIYTVYYI